MIVVASPTKSAVDLNADGRVDAGDIAFLMASFGKSNGAAIEGDLDGDGQIGVKDALIVRNAFAASSAIVQATERNAADRAVLTLPVRRVRVSPAIVDSLLEGELRITPRAASRSVRALRR